MNWSRIAWITPPVILVSQHMGEGWSWLTLAIALLVLDICPKYAK